METILNTLGLDNLRIFDSSFLGGVAAIFLVGFILIIISRVVVPYWSRNTKNQYDDLVVEQIEKYSLYFIVAGGLLYLSKILVSEFLDKELLIEDIKRVIDIANNTYITLLAYFFLIGLVRKITSHYEEENMGKADARKMNVVIPLIKNAVPILGSIIVFLLATFFLSGFTGLEFVLTTLGGLSFILVFLFKEPLSNLFSGIYLLSDTPFQIGDLLQLEDGKRYRIDKIGTRVTTLFNISEENTAVIPNDVLATQTIRNITSPTVEVRKKISIGVSYSTDIKEATEILVKIASSHPFVIGVFKQKAEAIKSLIDNPKESGCYFSEFSEIGLLKGLYILRLNKEENLRNTSDQLINSLIRFERHLHHSEDGGISPDQKKDLLGNIDDIEKVVTAMNKSVFEWLYLISVSGFLYENYKVGQLSENEIKDIISKLNDSVKKIDANLFCSSNIAWNEFYVFYDSLLKPHRESAMEGSSSRLIQIAFSQYNRWHRNSQRLVHDLVKIKHVIEGKNKKISISKLDTETKKIIEWMRENFLTKIEARQLPGVSINEFSDSAIVLDFEFYIDDIQGENFERESNTLEQLNFEIKRQFDIAGIEMPFPQMEVSLTNKDAS